MPRLQSVLLMGICKDAFAALILAQRLKKDFPHLHIGVWGCPWPVDLSGQSPVYRGIKVSPSHEQIRKKRPFKNLLERYGDPLKLLQQPESSGLCLFAFYSTSQHWTLGSLPSENICLSGWQQGTSYCCSRKNRTSGKGKAGIGSILD